MSYEKFFFPNFIIFKEKTSIEYKNCQSLFYTFYKTFVSFGK